MMKVVKKPFSYCIVILSVAPLFLGSLRERLEETNWIQLEQFLREAKIISVVINEDAGRTAPWDVTLDDGKIQSKARFKNIDRSRPDFLPDSYHYEIAAYELSKLLDLPIIPPVVEREIEGARGALQLYLESCIPLDRLRRTDRKLPDSQKLTDALDELTIFENLTYCMREESDVLIHEKDGKVFRVDFSEAFTPDRTLIPGSGINRCSAVLYKKLTSTNPEDLQSRLVPHLNADEIEALVKRIDLIIRLLKERIRERGEEKVLFEI